MSPHRLLKTAAVTLAVVIALAAGATLAVRARMRDEGLRSVAAALDAAFGQGGWTAGAMSFELEGRAFTAESVTFELPVWLLPRGGREGEAGTADGARLEAGRLVIKAPPLPMALNALAEGGFTAEADGTELFGSLELHDAKLPVRRGGNLYRIEMGSLTIARASLGRPRGQLPAPVPGQAGGLAASGVDIAGFRLYREGWERPFAKFDTLAMKAPGLLRPRHPPPADGSLSGLLTSPETVVSGLAVDEPGFALALDRLTLSGPLSMSAASGASLRSGKSGKAEGLSIAFGFPGTEAAAEARGPAPVEDAGHPAEAAGAEETASAEETEDGRSPAAPETPDAAEGPAAPDTPETPAAAKDGKGNAAPENLPPPAVRHEDVPAGTFEGTGQEDTGGTDGREEGETRGSPVRPEAAAPAGSGNAGDPDVRPEAPAPAGSGNAVDPD
ncbi:MAG: hypothetical protein LBQ79_00265, partial [Deltaproteobacteria bacterium]|nr:hypothetical protein [Deltaproteobacteria bacterium]